MGSLFVYRPSFAFIVGIAVLYGCYELAQALATAGIRVSLAPLLVGSAAMLIAAWERGPSGLVLGVLVTLAGVLVWRIADGALGYTRDVTASALVVLYLPTLAGFAILLAHPDDGAGRVIAFVATVVCSDTGGYATGVLFGKHPLAPIVSKAKTWEGFAGSVVACSVAGVLLMTLTFHEAWWKGLLFGLAIVVTATLGDLGESMIKRDLDVKDMGTLLPGSRRHHGPPRLAAALRRRRVSAAVGLRPGVMARHAEPADVVAAAQSLAARPGNRTAFLGIDGFGAAGKSSLAAAVAAAVTPATVVAVDDFWGPGVTEWDWDRFRRQVLGPLLGGRAARYQIWSWDQDRPGEWRDIAPGRLLVVEGVSSTRREAGVPWDLTVWVQAPREVRLARALERDGEAMRRRWLDEWMPAEEAYAARERPRRRVDLIVDGTV